MHKLVKCQFPIILPQKLIDHYYITGMNEGHHIDEGDLVIFKLMGAEFSINNVEFTDHDGQVESDVS